MVCNKIFRSEAAWDSHERSKKHLKEVERLQRQMLKEDEVFGLAGQEEDEGLHVDEDDSPHFEVERALEPPRSPSPPSVKSPGEVPETSENTSELSTRNASPESGESKENKRNKKGSGAKKRTLEPMSKTERRAMRRNQQIDSNIEEPEPNGVGEDRSGEADDASAQTQEPSKRDKRRAKQAKKAEVSSTTSTEVYFPSYTIFRQLMKFQFQVSLQHLR